MYVVPEISDPLRGVIVWGTPGLVGWFVLAAIVGMALRTLAGSSAARQRIERRPATMRGPLGRHRSSSPETGQLASRGSRRNGIDRPNLRRAKAGWAGLSK